MRNQSTSVNRTSIAVHRRTLERREAKNEIIAPHDHERCVGLISKEKIDEMIAKKTKQLRVDEGVFYFRRSAQHNQRTKRKVSADHENNLIPSFSSSC